jgi:hypothetical protein
MISGGSRATAYLRVFLPIPRAMSRMYRSNPAAPLVLSDGTESSPRHIQLSTESRFPRCRLTCYPMTLQVDARAR